MSSFKWQYKNLDPEEDENEVLNEPQPGNVYVIHQGIAAQTGPQNALSAHPE